MSTQDQLTAAVNDIYEEYIRAFEKHKPIRTNHEGYAVILEELDELWEAVRGNEVKENLRTEACQVAAMALRFMVDLCANP